MPDLSIYDKVHEALMRFDEDLHYDLPCESSPCFPVAMSLRDIAGCLNSIEDWMEFTRAIYADISDRLRVARMGKNLEDVYYDSRKEKADATLS